MTRFVWPAVIAAVMLPAPVAVAADPPQRPRVVVRETIVVRLRAVAPTRAGPAWHEKKAQKCVELRDIGGAAVNQPDAVDLILRGGNRVRARFNKACPALDFYSGFYLKPTEDGRICAQRDAVRSRSGGACTIDRFRRLVQREGSKR